MARVVFRCLILIFMIITSGSRVYAGELFRYDFNQDDTLHYNLVIESDLQFPELGNLAQLLNLETIKNNFDMAVELAVKSFHKDEGALFDAIFTSINSVTILGDSAYVDRSSGWGKVRPGSKYEIFMTPRGEMELMSRSKIVAGKQVVDMMQRFMPIYPQQAIEVNHNWSDTLGFDLELPNQPMQSISTVISYSYAGKDDDSKLHRFGYQIYNVLDDSEMVKLNGNGQMQFDNSEGRLISNVGFITIDAEISLAAFGLPEALGTTSVHIDSQIKLEFIDDK